MNFLAHAVLAGHQHDVVLGSLAGDFVKGVLRPGSLPDGVLLGVRLHRRIDAVSNRQPDLRAAVGRLPAELRRYAPPCLDMLIDHFLVADLISGAMRCPGHADFDSYRAWLYALPQRHAKVLTSNAARFFDHAAEGDLYLGYGDWPRLTRAIGHVCERMRQGSLAPAMTAALAADRTALYHAYRSAWPDLAATARDFLRSTD